MILLQPLAPMSKLQSPAALIFKLCQKTGRANSGVPNSEGGNSILLKNFDTPHTIKFPKKILAGCLAKICRLARPVF